jgi:hypothetical protein
LLGYETPNIDRIGKEGIRFLQYYGGQPFTPLHMQKVFNVMQDPFERADITSNTFWDWQINHVGSIYGIMEDVFKFAATFKDYPPRSYPPSFNPANIMEEVKARIKAKAALEKAFPTLEEEKPK